MKPRLRAAFVGTEAARLLARLDGPVLEGERWSFHAVIARVGGGEWARGVDVLVLGALGEVRRTALLHAVVAAVPRIVIVAGDDDDERAQRQICAELGLDGDEAAVVRPDHLDVLEAMDRTAVAPPPSAVLSGFVVSVRERHVELRGTVLRGSLQTGARAHVLAAGAWLECAIGRIACRSPVGDGWGGGGSYGPADVGVAGDLVAVGLTVDSDAAALKSPADSSVIEALVVDEPLPLVSTLAHADSIEPLTPDTGSARAFLGWTTARARIDAGSVALEQPQPAPPRGCYYVLPR